MRQQKRTSFSSADAFILWHLARQREPANFQVRGCSMLLLGTASRLFDVTFGDSFAAVRCYFGDSFAAVRCYFGDSFAAVRCYFWDSFQAVRYNLNRLCQFVEANISVYALHMSRMFIGDKKWLFLIHFFIFNSPIAFNL